jgi:DNA ligase (NAD+)
MKYTKQQINELEERYLKGKIGYYDGVPTMSDTEFDYIEAILKEYGSKVPEQVGSKRKDFDFTHPTKMLSLDKIQIEATEEGTNYMESDFLKWYNKCKSVIGHDIPLLSSCKYDGNAINIIYRGLKLANVLTRGDGFTGKDILKRFQNMIPAELDLIFWEGIPGQMDFLMNEDVVEIRCEVVIPTALFKEKYSEEFANPRNYVAGVIGNDEEDMVKISELHLKPLHFLVNGQHVNQRHFNNDLYRSTFISNNTMVEDVTAESFIESMKAYERLREVYEYQIDGVVYSLPVEYRALLGENSHDPEWARAIKFVPAEAITPWAGYFWNNSKRGEIVPTILLEPVLLDGSTVRRASGYNAAYLIEHKIGPGSVVVIAKAGDIIPEIQRVIIESEVDVMSLFPKTCPACGTPTEFTGVHLICPNANCKGRVAKQLSGAVKLLELRGIGEKTIEPFAEDFKNMYELIHNILTLEKSNCDYSLEKYGLKNNSRSKEIFVNAFKNIKSLTYGQVIQMLGYDNVGDKISIQLAREHAGLDFDYANLERALVAKLRSPEVSDYIKEVVAGLESLGILIDKPKKAETMEGTIYVCMTGSPKSFGFPTKAEFIAKFPMLVDVSITDKKCQFLITDSYSSTSNKMGVAEKKNIPIRTYGDFKA